MGYAISKASDKPVAGDPAFGAGAEDSLSKEQEKVIGGRPDKGKPMRRSTVRCVAVGPLRLAGKTGFAEAMDLPDPPPQRVSW